MRDRVEGLFRKHGILLDLEAKLEKCWEGICEGQDTEGANKTGDIRELRNGGRDDEGQSPVGGDHDNPKDLAHPDSKRRSVKELLEDVGVDDLDADVAVQGSSNKTRDDVTDIGGGLIVVWRETLHNRVIRILTLIAVDKDAEEHVNNVDKDLGADQAFPEVPWMAHLRQEVKEQHCSSVRVDGLVQTVERGNKAYATAGHTCGRLAGIGVNRTRAEGGSERGRGGCKVGG